MAPRSVWKGVISFGMVAIPIKLFNATSSNDLTFVTLHRECNQRIRQKRWCPQHDAEVQADAAVRAYEYSTDQYVLLEDHELDALRVASSHTIQISRFVGMDAVDPVYFDRAYVMEPEPIGVKPFYLLQQSMLESGLAAVATITMRQKESQCVLRIYGTTIMLHTMHQHDEVKGTADIELPQGSELPAAEKEMAMLLIDHLKGEFDPASYKDRYREALLNLIEAKINHTTPISVPAAPAQGKVGDLMEALKASIEAAKKSQPAASRRPDANRDPVPTGPAGSKPADTDAEVSTETGKGPAPRQRRKKTAAKT